MKNIIIILVFIFIDVNKCINIIPQPQNLILGQNTIGFENPLEILIIQQSIDNWVQLSQVTEYFLNQTFPSVKTISFITTTELEKDFPIYNSGDHIQIHLNLRDTTYFYEMNTVYEKYSLQIDGNGLITINASYYVGYIRALDTLSQIVKIKDDSAYEFDSLPLFIDDEPHFAVRGIMVDSSRHFLSVKTLERTIDSMMMNKLNVMHWHITDDESFPWLLKNYSQITKSGAYSDKMVYTYDSMRHIIDYASKRGVKIIPEIDTPSHTWSWGKSENLTTIVLLCGRQYGQFDPTLELTYTVVQSVMEELLELFHESPYVHFGGDEVNTKCWDQRPQIKEFMISNNISDYVGLQEYYRERQKSIWRDIINSTKPVLYWTNENENLQVQEDDIIHYWGSSINAIASKENKIILSFYNLLYLDTGMNNAFGDQYSTFHTWKNIYQQFDPLPQGIQGEILGGIAALWGETNSDSTHFMKLYTRTSVLAERLWNPQQKDQETLTEFVKRLVQMEYRMEKAGFPVMPSSSQFCSLNLETCFGLGVNMETLLE